jgi:lysophospholipase L1-like esterase
MPCITSENYYDLEYEGTSLRTKYNGKEVKTYWGEGDKMTRWQVAVNYTHSDTWSAYTQETWFDSYIKFIQKLEDGKNVTIVFYGDSITRGANASYYVGVEPYQMPYPLLFTYALADMYEYTVKHIPVGQPSTADKPGDDYVAGYRGNIYFINGSVGGWRSETGINNVKEYITDHTDLYGCDLFVIAFGMNDGGTNLKKFSANIKKTVNAVLKSDKDTSVMLVSSMEPNPEGINWQGDQDKHEEVLLKLAEGFNKDGVPCGLACMNSVSQAVLTRKQFVDYTGNNINHPNDFFMRVYAQTLLQTLVGYENLK